MPPPKTLARIAGLLYLILVVAAAFPEIMRAATVESGDAAATADNIRASATLFRLSFVSDLMASIAFLLTAMALYLLLRHVNQLVAAAMVTFVALSVAVGSLNILNHYTALTIATSDAYTRTFGKAGADTLTLLFADMHSNGVTLNAIWYGPWLVPLGYLVIRSGYFPKALGVLPIIGCFGYLARLFTTFLAPDAPAAIGALFLAVGAIGELSFVAWLLAKGVRSPLGDRGQRPRPGQTAAGTRAKMATRGAGARRGPVGR
jgi:Domain of unknown function (DUF4386)